MADKVPVATRADVIARLARLRKAPRADVDATAEAMRAALGPHKDDAEALAALSALCAEVAGGVLDVEVLHEAFWASCLASTVPRGAVFMALVARGKAKRSPRRLAFPRHVPIPVIRPPRRARHPKRES